MAQAQTGKFRCGQKIDHWNATKWDNGNGCVEKCERLANIYGFGCCEARPKSWGAFCVFGKILVKGYPDTKTVNCLGELFKELNIFSVRFLLRIASYVG